VAQRLNKVGYKSLWISIPLLYNGIFQLLHVYGWVWSGINPSLKFIPKMFNWGHVWWQTYIEAQFNMLLLLFKINCCVTLAVCGLAPSCCRIPFPSGKLSYMKRTTLFANTSFTYTLAFMLRLKTTRRVLLCRVIPPIHVYIHPWRPIVCLDVFVAVAVRILSRRWFTLICWTWRWVVTRGRGCPGLGRSFTLPVWWTRCSRRVSVDTLQPIVATMFCLFQPAMSILSALFLSFSESRGITVPKLTQH